MKFLFLDESGDHNLTLLDPSYPLFVLAGCVMDGNYHDQIFTPRLKQLKIELLGKENTVFHYVDYTRNKNGFEPMVEKTFRERFYRRLNEVIAEADFNLLSCIVDKKKHIEKYDRLAIDPYILSLEVIIERFIKNLQVSGEKGIVIAESRGHQLDNELELAYLDLKIRGTRFLRPKDIIGSIDGFHVRRKEDNIAGLQLADSVVTTIGRRYLGKVNYYLDYEVIKGKFRKNYCGKYRGYGLVILPK